MEKCRKLSQYHQIVLLKFSDYVTSVYLKISGDAEMVHKDSVKDLDFIGLQVQTRTSNGVFRGNRSRVERKTSVSQMVVFPQT